MLGVEPLELLGHSWQVAFDPADRETIRQAIVRAMTGEAQRLEARARRADGSGFDAECELVANLDGKGGLSGLHYFLRDVSSRTAAEQAVRTSEGQLAHLASHDELTALPNRGMLLERLRDAIRQSRREARTVGLFFIDLDGFKSVNNTLGHEAGDEVLRAVVNRLQKALRTSDLLARSGGDKFVAVCADLTHEEDAYLVAQKMTDALAEPLSAESGSIRMRASIGIALSHGKTPAAEDMLHDADMAMCQAKQDGGGRYKLCDDPMRNEVLQRLETERDISEGLRQGKFRLAYQPIVTARDQLIVGCEALARWDHPERGEVGPGEFIPIAERAGSILELGDWVLTEACRQMAAWSSEQSAAAELTMWVNVSAIQFDDPGFPSRVASILTATAADPHRLHFEVTETALLDIPSPTTTRVVQQLRALGIRIALDDFGTGYSSLTHIRRLPISAIKLDPSFVAQSDADSVIVPIVNAIATMARSLSISLVAEGVETEQQLAAVIEHGCPLIQGFLIARPMAAGDLAEWAARHGSTGPLVRVDAGEQATIGIGEAAANFHVSPSTIRRWVDSGRLGNVRTKGGHRRILAADVRNEARRLGPNVKLNVAGPPTDRAPRLASILQSQGEAVVASATTDVYGCQTVGWFGAAGSLDARRQWVASLADGCQTGDYARAMRASMTFFRQADIAGATVLERHLLTERVRVRLVHLLRTSDSERSDMYTAVKLLQAVDHATLGAA